MASPTFGGGGQQGPKTVGTLSQRQGGGFNFSNGNAAISAGTYASLNKIPIGQLLFQMAQGGDKYAGQAYNQIKANQQYYNAHPEVLKKEFAPLFWG